MPGFGPAPAESRRRRNADTFEESAITVSTDTIADAPELPGEHLPETVAWYRTWSECPQAQAFLATDWQRLHMIAFLVDRYYDDPSEKRFAEIRQNESLLGATHLDRLRGRIKVARPTAPSTPGTVASLDDRRQRLMSDA